MKKATKRQICIIITFLCAALLCVYELFNIKTYLGIDASYTVGYLTDMTITRALAGIAFFAMLTVLGFKVLNPIKKPFWSSVLFCLPPLALCINNMPIIPLLSGKAILDAPIWRFILLAFECLAIGLFEEMAFRGVVFLSIVEKKGDTKRGLFWSIVVSSLIFGAVHLLNMFTSSPTAVLMQIGYSALIGAMCSVVLLKTKNIWLCVALHAIYDFCGQLVEYCGRGVIWDTPTVVLTAIVALAVAIYMIYQFIKLPKFSFEK